MKCFRSLPLFVLLAAPCLLADTYMVCRQGGCIAPVKSNEVWMESEVVKVSKSVDIGYTVEAVFRLKNTSPNSITSLVAFPVLELPGFVLKEVDRDFKVEVGTLVREAPVFAVAAFRSDLPSNVPSDSTLGEMMLAPPKDVMKYPKNIVWKMAWAANETKLVRIRYTTDRFARVSNSTFCTDATQLTYVVSTGNLWKGKIGKADFVFDFATPSAQKDSENGTDSEMKNPNAAPDPSMLKIASYPDTARWVTSQKLEWHFEDWAPTDEIFVRWVQWQDVPPYDEDGHEIYYYGLAATYVGDRELYSNDYLALLLTQETRLAKQYFPQQLTSIQLLRLDLWISEWLLHEIIARHGQEFDPIDHYESNGANRYPVRKATRWGTAFMGYSWHGGWYKPTGQVDEAKLSATEKANLVFLRERIERCNGDLLSLRK